MLAARVPNQVSQELRSVVVAKLGRRRERTRIAALIPIEFDPLRIEQMSMRAAACIRAHPRWKVLEDVTEALKDSVRRGGGCGVMFDLRKPAGHHHADAPLGATRGRLCERPLDVRGRCRSDLPWRAAAFQKRAIQAVCPRPDLACEESRALSEKDKMIVIKNVWLSLKVEFGQGQGPAFDLCSIQTDKRLEVAFVRDPDPLKILVQFLAPGILTMTVIQNAFANSSSSILVAKVQGNIVDTLMPPLSGGELVTGYIAGGIARGLIVAVAIAIGLWLAFGIGIAHPLWMLTFTLLGATFMAALGIVAAIFANKFDQMAAITNFIVTPLAFLSGTFYSITALPPALETLSRFNPVFYMIDGARYGMIGISDGSPWLGLVVCLVSCAGLIALCWYWLY